MDIYTFLKLAFLVFLVIRMAKAVKCPDCGKTVCACEPSDASCCGSGSCDPNNKKYKGVVKLLMALVLALVALKYLDLTLALWFFAVVLAAKGLVCMTKKC